MLRAKARREESVREKIVRMSRLMKVASEMRFWMEEHSDKSAGRGRQPLGDFVLVGRNFLVRFDLEISFL